MTRRQVLLLIAPLILGVPLVVVYRTLGPVRVYLPPKGDSKGITLLRALADETKRHPYAISILVERQTMCRDPTMYRHPEKQLKPAVEYLYYVRRDALWLRPRKKYIPGRSWFGRRDETLDYDISGIGFAGGAGWGMGHVDDAAIQSTAKVNISIHDDYNWFYYVRPLFPVSCVGNGVITK